MRIGSILAAALWLFTPTIAAACVCHGCGCKGGPGFRGLNGRCVSYKKLDETCGSPPTTRCVYEHVKQECEHEGAMPDEKGMQKFKRSLEGLPDAKSF